MSSDDQKLEAITSSFVAAVTEEIPGSRDRMLLLVTFDRLLHTVMGMLKIGISYSAVISVLRNIANSLELIDKEFKDGK